MDMRYFKISFLAAALLSLLMSCDHAGKSEVEPLAGNFRYHPTVDTLVVDG